MQLKDLTNGWHPVSVDLTLSSLVSMLSSVTSKDVLTAEQSKIAATVAAGAAATGALVMYVRWRDRALPALEITTLEDLRQYHVGGVLRDAAAWLITPRVTAVRVTGHGNRVPALPRALCSLSQLQELKVDGNFISELPREIGRLNKLLSLDVTDNLLTELPAEIGALTGLTSLNAMGNRLETLPDTLGSLLSLRRLGLKSNCLVSLPSSIGQLTELRELFLTDNQLESLPEDIGGCVALVKLQASHNALTLLPASLASLPNLELVRVACCNIAEVPAALASARSLAWLSIATNPACNSPSPRRSGMPTVALTDLDMGRKLGDGASGEVFEASWKGRRVAVKLFRTDRSPDGHSADEIAIACALTDKNLIKVLARVENPLGLVMEYFSGEPLAEKPNHSSLLRCRWPADAAFELGWVLRVASGIASALEHMHSKGVSHGDVYAHNVLVDDEGNALLCDYGASFFYPRNNATLAAAYEGMDGRAFGLFLRDLLQRVEIGFEGMEAALDAQKQLLLLVQQCSMGPAANRPRMGAVARKLRSLQKAAAQGTGSSPRSDSRLAIKADRGVNGARAGLATAR